MGGLEVVEYGFCWGSRGTSGQEYYKCGFCIARVARLDCAERELLSEAVELRSLIDTEFLRQLVNLGS